MNASTFYTTTETSSISTAYDYSDYYGSGNNFGSEPCAYGRYGKHLLPVFYSLVFVAGLLGNMLVLWVILMGAQLKSMTDVCLLNLALADLFLVFSLPFLAHYARDTWAFGKIMCTVVLGVYFIGFYGGIFFIVLMSIDRYLAIVHAVYALRIRTKVYATLASLFVWILAISASFPELTNIETTKFSNEIFCEAYPTNETHKETKTAALLKMNILGLLVPLAIITFCYSMVLWKLFRVRSSRKQAIRLVIMVVLVFFFCWTPYNIAAFLRALELNRNVDFSCPASKTIRLMLQITEAFAYSHSCLNPFLYAFVSHKFKKQLARLLRQTPLGQLQIIKNYISQTTMSTMHSQSTSVGDRSTALRVAVAQ